MLIESWWCTATIRQLCFLGKAINVRWGCEVLTSQTDHFLASGLEPNTCHIWRGIIRHGGHLRPQNPVTCDHKQKNRIWVTCDHKVRSLTATKRHIRWQGQQNLRRARGHLWPHFAVICDQKLGSLGLIRITCTHARGGWDGWGGWGGGMITYLALAHILAEHITCIHALGGMIPFRD